MNTTYRIKQLMLVALTLIGFGCTDFVELNTDPTKAPSIDPNTQLTMCQLQTWGNWQASQSYTFYLAGFVQYQQGDWNTTNWGGQYRKSNNEFLHTWEELYGKQIKNLVDVVVRTKDDSLRSNIHQIARIYKAFTFATLTDLYGDLPYFEAGLGYSHDIVKPKYDAQEDIYMDILKELKEAAEALSPEADQVTGDVIYSGNITKWKRLANSLSLRYALRLVKVAPEIAKQEVIRLTENEIGFISSAAEEALIPYTNINDWDVAEYRRNALAQMWRGREPYPTTYICKTFWDMLQSKKDPRQFLYGRCYDESSPNNPFERVDLTDEMIALGDHSKFQPSKSGAFWWDNWPSGYWSNLTNKWQDKALRPQVNNAFLRGDVPGVVMSLAETQLLLCEAKARFSTEVITGGVASMHYKNGINAAFDLLDKFGLPKVEQSKRDQYIADNPFPGAANAEARLQVINEQLWILHFNNTPEGFANWRRSGYPVLQPSVAHGAVTIDSQTIPRRLCYPLFESSYNPEGYAWALNRMGGTDSWNKSVWWDKQ